MRAPAPNSDGMGSQIFGSECRFRVWAPNAQRVQLMLNGAPPIDLASEGASGNWSADMIPANPGDKYQYIITTRPGPDNDTSQPWFRTDARALQVESSGQQSQGYVVAPFPDQRQPFTTPPFDAFLLYQLHIGSFAGRNDGIDVKAHTATFVDCISKLDYIKSLGFNAICPLPITDARNDLNGAGEGYGPCDLYASEDAYATSPELAVPQLLELIDAAHSKGLAVILDVVYNHASTIDNRYWQYDGNHSPGDDGGGIYHVHGFSTSWGQGFATWQQEVKDFLLDNARMYLRDYRVDGLRFDAAHAIPPDAVQYIVQNLRHEFPDKYLIAEYSTSDAANTCGPLMDPFGPLGFCATWDLDSPWDTSKLLDGENTVDLLLRRIGQFADPNNWHSITYLTGSHDQIYLGEHRDGAYLTQRFGGRGNGFARAKARLAWALNATLPGTPMLFMGTEGHLDGFWDPVVSGGDHRLDWSQIGDELGAPMQRLVHDANQLRWAHPALRGPAGQVVHIDRTNNVLAFKRWNDGGNLLLIVVNAGDNQWSSHEYDVSLPGDDGSWQEAFNSQAPTYGGIDTPGNFGFDIQATDNQLPISLPSWSVLVFTRR